jgi:transcriptional regulator with XRE-family HTH domain
MATEHYHFDVSRELGILAENVKNLRKKKGLSQRQLGTVSSISPAIISGIENGTGNPSVLAVCRLAEALDVSPGDLLTDCKKNRLILL